MRPNWVRWRKLCVALSYGGITLGILQGLQYVNFANLFTQLLAQWLSALIAVLLGGQIPTSLTNIA